MFESAREMLGAEIWPIGRRRLGSLKLTLIFLCHLSICLAGPSIEKLPPPPLNEEIDSGSKGYYPGRTYVTAEGVKSPDTQFVQWSPECDDGLNYFITPRGHSIPRPGPVILDRRGELIWGQHFDNSFGGEAYNFLVQNYKGEDYLTFWLGDDRIRGHGSGFYYMFNSSYHQVKKIGGANGLTADLHEFLITPEGTALMTVYEIVPGDVSMIRDFDASNPSDKDPNWIWDGVLQEVDIETGEAVFEWRSSEHVAVTESYRPIYTMGTREDPWDWFHINSIHKDELSNYLVSARYTHSLTYIDGKTKETIWQLGGRSNMFMDLSDGHALDFCWQHDARFRPLDTFPNMYTPPTERPGYTTQLLTLFDNTAEDQHYHFGHEESRGLLLEITYPTPGTEKATAMTSNFKNDYKEVPPIDGETADMRKLRAINGTDPDYTVRVIKEYVNPQRTRSSSQGNVQLIPQGRGKDPKVVVGFGLSAVWTEFDSNGTALCDVHYGSRTSWEGGHVQSYRAYKFPWTGHPETTPSVEITDDDAEVLVSWNGATDVVEWVLQCSEHSRSDEKSWHDLARVPKHTFETTIQVPDTIGDTRYLRVIALAENGRRMDYGTSKIIDRGIMASYFPNIKQELPQQVSHLSPLKLLLIIACNVSLLFVLYEIYRRYLSARFRPSAGPFRFRKEALYRLIGENV